MVSRDFLKKQCAFITLITDSLVTYQHWKPVMLTISNLVTSFKKNCMFALLSDLLPTLPETFMQGSDFYTFMILYSSVTTTTMMLIFDLCDTLCLVIIIYGDHFHCNKIRKLWTLSPKIIFARLLPLYSNYLP